MEFPGPQIIAPQMGDKTYTEFDLQWEKSYPYDTYILINENGNAFSGPLSFSRAGTAYQTKSDGTLEQVAADVPRLANYVTDPVTGERVPAWRLELGRTNLVSEPESITAAGWSASGNGIQPLTDATRTEDFGAAPDGSMTADRYQHTAEHDGDNNFLQYAMEFTAGKTYTFSVWLRSLTGGDLPADVGAFGSSVINVQANITITPTWQRFTWSAVASGTGSGSARPLMHFSQDVGTMDALVWGLRVVEGDFDGSYHPDVRPAELASLPLPPSLAVPGAMTVYVRWIAAFAKDGGLATPFAWAVGDDVGAARLGLYQGDNSLVAEYVNDGGLSNAAVANPAAPGDIIETLVTLDTDGRHTLAASIAGGAASSTTSATPRGLAADWGVDRIYLASRAGSNPGAMDLLSLLVLPTTLTGTPAEMMAYCREAAASTANRFI